MSREKNLVKIKKSKNQNTIFGLPAKSYIDEDFWKQECETVLSNGWLFVGFSHELKKSGCNSYFYSKQTYSSCKE